MLVMVWVIYSDRSMFCFTPDASITVRLLTNLQFNVCKSFGFSGTRKFQCKIGPNAGKSLACIAACLLQHRTPLWEIPLFVTTNISMGNLLLLAWRTVVELCNFRMFSFLQLLLLTAAPLENWRRPPGRPHTTWMKTIQQDLKSNNVSENEAIDVAQN